MNTDSTRPTGFRAWRAELFFAVPIIALVVSLFYNWFAVQDRYLIFLYYHDMGSRFDTTPFGWVTTGRYWMSGLVASGMVMVPYVLTNLVLGRVVKRFRAPEWRRLWLLCAIPLLIAIPAIVMTVNDPVLPLGNAAQVTAATLIGLALAVMMGRAVAESPRACALLMIDGLALTCLLCALIRIESIPGWLARGNSGVIYTLIAMVVAGLTLLVLMTAFYYWRRSKAPDARSSFVASLTVMYLLLPLSHHLLSSSADGSLTSPVYSAYISDAENFFARDITLQVTVWIVVALIALATARWRRWLWQRRTKVNQPLHQSS